MSERLLRATIREIKVEYNGADAVGTKQSRRKSASRNVVVAVLAYPRSGTSVVTSLKELDLPSGEVLADFGKRPSFWDNGLFKEVVQGETALKISVTDRNRHNPIVRFLDRSMGGGLGVLFRGRTGGMLGGLVGNLTKALSDAIADSEQKVRNLTVATTDRAQIVIGESGELSVPNAGKAEDAPVRFEDGRLRLAFRSPRRFTHTVLDRTRGARASPDRRPATRRSRSVAPASSGSVRLPSGVLRPGPGDPVRSRRDRRRAVVSKGGSAPDRAPRKAETRRP